MYKNNRVYLLLKIVHSSIAAGTNPLCTSVSSFTRTAGENQHINTTLIC